MIALNTPERRVRARNGPAAVMQAAWTDPDDMGRYGKTARQINGHRTYCPLRSALRRHSGACNITDRHIIAADRLRMIADLVVIGASGAREPVPILSLVYGPRTDFPAAAYRQTAAAREFIRVMRMFNATERAIITTVVLLNRPVTVWCMQNFGHSRPQLRGEQMTLLTACLDRLAEHYASEIDAGLKHGNGVIAA